MTAPLVTAVDPGSQYTGIVARSRNNLLAWTVVDRTRLTTIEAYAHELLEHIVATNDHGITALDHQGHDVDYDHWIMAVEHFHTPTGKLGRIDPQHLTETAWLTGWLYAALRGESTDGPSDPLGAVLMPPNDFGRAPLGAYPPELVTSGERRGQWQIRPAGRSTKVSHARSAWDLAGAASAQLRTRYAAEGA